MAESSMVRPDGRIPLEELTAMMLKGQNNLVIQYLRALPKDECAVVRSSLIKGLETIQKSRTDEVAHTDKKKSRGSHSPSSSRHKERSKDYEKSERRSRHADASLGSSAPTSPSSISHISGSMVNTGSLGRVSGKGVDGDRKRSYKSSKSAAEFPLDSLKNRHSSRSPSPQVDDNGSGSESVLGSYRKEEEIGKGMFGVVHRAVHVETGQAVAIKEVDVDQVDPTKLPSIMREADVLSSLDHPNIVQIYHVHKSKKRIYFVLEYIDSGSFLRLIKRVGLLPEKMVAVYAREILEGLRYLHDKGVIHRDIKAANILLSSNGHCKLIDFGTAKPEDTNKNFTVVGTPYWMAPEIIEMEGGGIASDIWSLGCTVLELLTGAPPFFELSTMQALFSIVEEKHPPLPENISSQLRSFLIDGCFVKDPHARPSAANLLKHPWITSTANEPPPTYEELTRAISNSGARTATGSSGGSRSLGDRRGSGRTALSVPKDTRSSTLPLNLLKKSNDDELPNNVEELQALVKKLQRENELLRRENSTLKAELTHGQ